RTFAANSHGLRRGWRLSSAATPSLAPTTGVRRWPGRGVRPLFRSPVPRACCRNACRPQSAGRRESAAPASDRNRDKRRAQQWVANWTVSKALFLEGNARSVTSAQPPSLPDHVELAQRPAAEQPLVAEWRQVHSRKTAVQNQLRHPPAHNRPLL